ncbi:hypothetical protein N7453_002352 [Penicillium expansum]|nr:hypothetical protein N7453_002352 [Penicillium expansum]
MPTADLPKDSTSAILISSETQPAPPPLIPYSERPLDSKADREKVPSSGNEHLELPMQLRLRRDTRAYARDRIFQEACGIMQTVQNIVRKYLRDGQTPAVLFLWTLERRMQCLVTAMVALNVGEERALDSEETARLV